MMLVWQAFTRVDTHTGEAQTWFPGRRCFCEELIFVNKPGATGGSREDDGYLLGLVYDASRHRSFLAVRLLSTLTVWHDCHSKLAATFERQASPTAMAGSLATSS